MHQVLDVRCSDKLCFFCVPCTEVCVVACLLIKCRSDISSSYIIKRNEQGAALGSAHLSPVVYIQYRAAVFNHCAPRALWFTKLCVASEPFRCRVHHYSFTQICVKAK